MIAKTVSFGTIGIEAYPVEIEVDVSLGLTKFKLVGMADTAIRESKERVKSAIKNSGFLWPEDIITVSLAPSDIKKEGAAFDCAIAIGILAASQQINPDALDTVSLIGELSLDGTLRFTRGVLSMALAAQRSPFKKVVIPRPNAKEAAIVSGLSVWPLKNLREVIHFLGNREAIKPFRLQEKQLFQQNSLYYVDFSEVKGNYFAKRAMEIAVSGGHNVLMIGPPGSGKTMLAKRIPTIMPELTIEEALEVTKIHSILGKRTAKAGIIGTRPFRNPHHNISSVAMVGGGSLPQPGEISLAHHGVLFLDELPEFKRDCLEALRQPLEDGCVRISRSRFSSTIPSSFMLVCAMNPCPCGYYTHKRKPCRCSTTKIQKYLNKISGPLLDRIDIHLEIPAVEYRDLTDTRESEPSSAIRERVEKARKIQRQRLGKDGVFTNARMTSKLTRLYCTLTDEATDLLKQAMQELQFSARAYEKILKVSRTIADLAGSEKIMPEHIAEAVQYRSLDRSVFF